MHARSRAHELQVLDLYSRQAADAIVRARVERDLATARSRLETALRVGEMGVYDWNMVTDQVYGDPNFRRMADVAFDEDGFAPRQAPVRCDPSGRSRGALKRVQRTPSRPANRTRPSTALPPAESRAG